MKLNHTLTHILRLYATACIAACALLITGVLETTAATEFYELQIGSERFLLELAADEETRSLGLGGRESIDANGGMIFVFSRPAVRSFFMRDCVIPIDIAFLDGAGRITATYTMTPEAPQAESETDFAYEQRLKRYSSRYRAKYAVELRAGTIERLGLRPADRLALDTRILQYALR